MRTPRRSPPVTEEIVAQLWAAQRLRRDDLRVIGGEPLEVVYRGRATDDRGPDFKEAIIAVGNSLRHGDVEIHLRTADWQLHGHHRDPYYNQVVLHVVLWHDMTSTTTLANGQSVPVLELCHYLPVPFESLPQALALPALPPDRCSRLARRQDEAALAGLLGQAGEERFHRKAARFAQELAVQPPEQVLYAGILEAFGYSKNTLACRQLADSFPLSVLEGLLWGKPSAQRELYAQALLLGAAGLLPCERVTDQEGEDHEAWPLELAAIWRVYGGESVVDTPWRFFRSRPENSPTRRVAGAALLFARHLKEGLLQHLEAALAGDDLAASRRRLESALIVPAPDYWSSRYQFGSPTATPRGALVGRERAAVAVINVVLPFFSALAGMAGPARLAHQALRLYSTYPHRAENSVTRTMARQLSLRPEVSRSLTAGQQQGLLHLYRENCQQGACSSCMCASAHSTASPR